MEKLAKYKSKNKKLSPKPKNTKKRKQSDEPSCSMFLTEITRKLTAKRRQNQEEAPRNIVQSIIDSLTNALPVIFSRKSPDILPVSNMESLAPELIPKDTLDILYPVIEETEVMQEIATTSDRAFKMPKMPLVNSEVIKVAIEKRRKAVATQDATTDTGDERDMATELVKHVNTLRKISLVAEEFNQKTAKNLKEIVDSVQDDLIKKLEEIQKEQKIAAAAVAAEAMEVKQFEDDFDSFTDID